MRVSTLYGKITEGKEGKRGYVISVNAAGGKIVSLSCADEDENLFFISAKNMKNTREKICYKAEGEFFGTPIRLGVPVYDCEGNFMGNLTELTAEKNEITFAYCGAKKYRACDIVLSDAVIVKSSARILKSDVKKDGKTILKKGTSLCGENLKKAEMLGEYVQANLKTL